MEEQENTVLVIDDEESIPDYCYQDLSRKGYRLVPVLLYIFLKSSFLSKRNHWQTRPAYRLI